MADDLAAAQDNVEMTGPMEIAADGMGLMGGLDATRAMETVGSAKAAGHTLHATPWSSTVHPAVLELDNRHWRLANFGLALYVISQAIPYFVLMNVRWMMAGSYVPRDVSHWLGGLLPTIFLGLGILFTWLGVGGVRAGKSATLQWSFMVSVLLGIGTIITLFIPLRIHSWDVMSHFGSIYVVCLGAALFYTFVTTVVVLGVVFRSRAGLIGPKTLFGPQSAAIVWTFNAIAWFALYVTLVLV